MKETNWKDLIDELMHLSEIETSVKAIDVDYNDNRFNHSELEFENGEFINTINMATSDFLDVIRTRQQIIYQKLEELYAT